MSRTTRRNRDCRCGSRTPQRYVAHFNARLRRDPRHDLDDVRLDLVNRTRCAARRSFSYFGNYAKFSDWRLIPGLVEGHPAILVLDPNAPGAGPKYFMLLGWTAGKVATIQDFMRRWRRTRGRRELNIGSEPPRRCDNCLLRQLSLGNP